MDNENAKKNLKELRKRAHLTQLEMAKSLGIKRTTYRNLESGPTKLINETVLKVAEFLNKPAEAILSQYDLSKGYSAVLCERNEEYEKKIVTLEQECSRLEQENRDLRELSGLYRYMLKEERKKKDNE